MSVNLAFSSKLDLKEDIEGTPQSQHAMNKKCVWGEVPEVRVKHVTDQLTLLAFCAVQTACSH